MTIREIIWFRLVVLYLNSFGFVFGFSFLTITKKDSFPDGLKCKVGVTKSFLELLKKEYISLAKVTEQISNTALTKALKKYNPEIIKLQQTVKTGMFIKVDDLNAIPDYINIVKSKELRNHCDFLTKKEEYKYLGISTTTMDTVIKDYKVNYEKVSGQMFFTKETLKSLKEEQKKARKLLDDYYLGSEVRRITNLISVSKGFGEKFERIP